MNNTTEKQVKLIKYKSTASLLTEIFQALAIRFSFVVKTRWGYKQIIPPCKCRDFLGDIPYSKFINGGVSIYGMSYDYTKKPYCNEYTQLSLTFPDQIEKNLFVENIPKFLWPIEDKAGVERTVILETQEDNTLIVIGSHHWQKITWELSLYTFYLKCCAWENPKKPKGQEEGYKLLLSEIREAALLSLITDDRGFFPTETRNNLCWNHSNCGFYSILCGKELSINNNKKKTNTHYFLEAIEAIAAKRKEEAV